MMYQVNEAKECRACLSKDINSVLMLRDMPPGDKYAVSPEDVPDKLISSHIQMCDSCGHVQMSGSASPDYIYGNYLSRPASTNPALAKQYNEYAKQLSVLANGGLIVEIGSNDGLFLEFFKDIGQEAVGIEPAKNLCQFAEDRGVKTINDFFSAEAVSIIKESYQQPSLVLANHSFSNVENIREYAQLLSSLLEDNGIFVIQSFYQGAVLNKYLLENYNHEHLSYLTLSNSINFFKEYDLYIEDAFLLDVKGGSIRMFFRKCNKDIKSTNSVKLILEEENKKKTNTPLAYEKTAEYISSQREKIHNAINSVVEKDDYITAYGTSIGATVFSYQYGIENKIKLFVDDDTLRQGRYAPGTGARVTNKQDPEFMSYKACIILAPLYADKIIENNKEYLKNGGVFIKMWPKVEVVSG